MEDITYIVNRKKTPQKGSSELIEGVLFVVLFLGILVVFG